MNDRRPCGDHRATPAAHETCLSIGGVTFRIVSGDPLLASSHEYDALRAFSVDRARPDVDVRASWSDTPPACDGELLFDSGGSWRLLKSEGDLIFGFRSSVGGSVQYKTARFDSTFAVGDVRLYRRHFDAGVSVYPLQYPLDELVMIHLLSQGRGIEIHGCALLDAAGQAYVFPGQSGAGKSTMARLWADWPEVTLLSDERVIVRTDGDRIAVFGTPWHGDALLASPLSGALAAVFFLNHHPTHAVIPTSRPLAAAKLLACAFLPFHSAAGVDRTMAAAERIARDVPCYDLLFAPHRSVVEILTRYMG